VEFLAASSRRWSLRNVSIANVRGDTQRVRCDQGLMPPRLATCTSNRAKLGHRCDVRFTESLGYKALLDRGAHAFRAVRIVYKHNPGSWLGRGCCEGDSANSGGR